MVRDIIKIDSWTLPVHADAVTRFFVRTNFSALDNLLAVIRLSNFCSKATEGIVTPVSTATKVTSGWVLEREYAKMTQNHAASSQGVLTKVHIYSHKSSHFARKIKPTPRKR